MDFEADLKQGIAFHNEGRLGDAARCYQAVLAADPGNVDALHLMSVLATMSGDAAFGVDLARQALAGDPSFFAAYVSLGNALQTLGQLEDAVGAFQQAVHLNPQSAEALTNLASALNDLERFDEACDVAARAVVLDPDLAEAQNNFGNALNGLGSPAEAAECYEKCLALRPDMVEAWRNLGLARAELGEREGAVDAFVKALELDPGPGRFLDLGNALLEVAQFDQAARCFAQAVEMDGGFVDAWMNLATALKGMGQLEQAEAVQRDALALAPDDAEAHFNLAVLLLQQGKMAPGWAEYEWRWKLPSFQPVLRPWNAPRWDGGRFDGKTLLVTVEQGFGDAIQFSRFLPQAAALGGRVILECRPELVTLMGTLAGVAQVVAAGDEVPTFDVHVPLMSLPGLLGVTLDTLPAQVPYLSVPAGIDDFADVAAATGLKVGLVWAGKASRSDNDWRSCRVEDLAPLTALSSVRLYSLQVGNAKMVGGVSDLGPRLVDFAHTAAAIQALDAVVAVDTAVAHLAGALGKPVWVLLSRPSNGFLWMDQRGDSPWYPTAKILRQDSPGDWSPVISTLCAQLVEMGVSG